jgi:hypothetical protein
MVPAIDLLLDFLLSQFHLSDFFEPAQRWTNQQLEQLLLPG